MSYVSREIHTRQCHCTDFYCFPLSLHLSRCYVAPFGILTSMPSGHWCISRLQFTIGCICVYIGIGFLCCFFCVATIFLYYTTGIYNRYVIHTVITVCMRFCETPAREASAYPHLMVEPQNIDVIQGGPRNWHTLFCWAAWRLPWWAGWSSVRWAATSNVKVGQTT